VHEIKLYEGSTVGFGMNELTPYLGVKGKEDITQVQLLERMAKLEKILKTGSLSDEELQSAEIQMIQVKQIICDIFEKYQIAPPKQEKEIKIDEEDSFFSDLVKEFIS
jgi:hypothetical protein